MKESEIMELWQHYSQLEQRKELTPLMVKQFIAKKSESDLQVMSGTTYSSIFVYAGLILLFLSALRMYSDDVRFVRVSIGGIVLSIIGLTWTVIFLRKLRSINFGSSSLAKVRTLVVQLRRLLRVEVSSLFVFMPMLLACVLPVVYMMVQQLNIFEEFARVAPRVLLTYAMIVALSLWIYRQYYYKKLDLFERRVDEYTSLEKQKD